jgi:rhamnose utilization protein RhaD (predicted bifunctional aldolase and dehydrogenase)
MTNQAVAELIARSNRLGSDPKNTNYAGGNTSAKGTETDPVTGEPVELLWVKGSAGDLGTLTESGLAVLRLDRMRQLVNVYPGVDREDEMVAAFDYCLHGKGGAAPSIDTAMHGLSTPRMSIICTPIPASRLLPQWTARADRQDFGDGGLGTVAPAGQLGGHCRSTDNS